VVHTAAGHELARWLSGDQSQKILKQFPKIRRTGGGFGCRAEFMSCWPSVVPSARELVARTLLPVFVSPDADRVGRVPTAVALAGLGGPIGENCRRVLAFGLGTASEDARADIVGALRLLARRSELEGSQFGTEIADLALTHPPMSLAAVAAGLAELAAGGAGHCAWEIVSGALRALLSPEVVWPAELVTLVHCAAALADVGRPADLYPDAVRAAADGDPADPASAELRRLTDKLRAMAPAVAEPAAENKGETTSP
jgi:hypothetical protein